MSTSIEQTLLSKTPLCPVETVPLLSWCIPMHTSEYVCHAFFDKVFPLLTTHQDSSHIFVCSDALNRHLYSRAAMRLMEDAVH